MNGYTQKTNYLPWILLGIAVLVGIGFVFLLVTSILVASFSAEQDYYPTKGNLAVVEINGIIDKSRNTIKTLRKLEKNKKVKAIVLSVNSPGGAVAPSQEIHDVVKDISKKKVVVASFGTVAASGAYYLSAPSRKIFASPGSLTGSIGVILEIMIIKDLLKKLSIDTKTIKSGRLKSAASPLKKMTPEEEKFLQKLSDNIHEQFKDAVSTDRKIPKETIDKIADGRVFTGEQALKLKLIDAIGGLDKACKEAAKMAGILGEPDIFYPPKPKKNFLEYLVESSAETVIRKLDNRLHSLTPLYILGR